MLNRPRDEMPRGRFRTGSVQMCVLMSEHLNAVVVLTKPGKIMLMRSMLTAGFAMLLSGICVPAPCPVRAFFTMAGMRAARRLAAERKLLVAVIAAVLCAACTASGGARPIPPSVALRPLDTRWPVPLLIWEYTPIVAPYTRILLFAAYDDGRIIFRASTGGYRTVIDTTLVRQLYGSASERAAYAALRDVRMPPEWQILDGGTKTMCLWTGGEMRCHHLDNPRGEYIGRPEACAGFAHDTTSYYGRRTWANCRSLSAAHAGLPTAFAAYYRRIYDAVQERADAAAPWAPGRVLLTVEEARCEDRVRTPWPEGVPRPREGERIGKTEWGELWRLAMTAEQARRLGEVDHASFTDCLVSDGSAWGWQAYFELPNLGVVWEWRG